VVIYPVIVSLLEVTETCHRSLVSAVVFEYGAVCVHRAGSEAFAAATSIAPEAAITLGPEPCGAIQKLELACFWYWRYDNPGRMLAVLSSGDHSCSPKATQVAFASASVCFLFKTRIPELAAGLLGPVQQISESDV
jgi:hypothetical protein